MTRQTAEPFDHISLNPTYRTADSLVRLVKDGSMLLDPPYQRGSVWTDDQRMALVESWLRGLPAGVVILADRGSVHPYNLRDCPQCRAENLLIA